jgi:hypothetical protein
MHCFAHDPPIKQAIAHRRLRNGSGLIDQCKCGRRNLIAAWRQAKSQADLISTVDAEGAKRIYTGSISELFLE